VRFRSEGKGSAALVCIGLHRRIFIFFAPNPIAFIAVYGKMLAMSMPNTAKASGKARLSMAELSRMTGVPVRTLYGLRSRRPELWAVIEDGYRARKFAGVLNG
jgi:hypothetical protein